MGKELIKKITLEITCPDCGRDSVVEVDKYDFDIEEEFHCWHLSRSIYIDIRCPECGKLHCVKLGQGRKNEIK